MLNDINPHLISFYRTLKLGVTVEDHHVQFKNDRRTYLRQRRRFNELIAAGRTDTDEAALLFYFLNRTGYNGLCRFNRRGLYNVPFGAHANINYLTDFSAYANTFERWHFSTGDFEGISVRPDDFIYADPPYDVDFTAYAPGGFTWDDQVRLARWLAAHPGPVLLSNQATPRILKLYRSLGFKLTLLDAPRHISCNGDRRPAKEVLATRNL
jgi:DNA adenine methylase